MATALDPTMELIRSLDDPEKWIVSLVPAFVPHERYFPERTTLAGATIPAITIKVTEEDLRREAARATERIRTTGRLDTVTIGHRNFDRDFPETQQPPLVGFCRNYSVQWIEREKGRFLALMYEECVARDKAEKHDLYRQYPFRSVEYHPSLGLAGVAALVRPPALNMGTTYLYQATEEPAVNPQEFKTLFAECMKTYQAELAAAEAEKKKKDDPVAKYEADIVAAVEAKKKEDEEKKKAATAAAGAIDANAVTAQYAADLAGLRQELAVEKTARTKAECRSMLDPMRGKVKFDYDREFAILTAMSDESRAAHVKYMAENYAPLPAGDLIRTYQGSPPGQNERPDDPHRDYADRAAVLTYIRSHPGCTYEDAEAAVAKK